MRFHSSQGQRGQVAVLFALAAVALVAIAGLALDAGQAFVSQRALQAGSDTAAQSGATMLAQDYSWCLNTPGATGYGPYPPLPTAGTSDISTGVTTLAYYAAAAQGRATAPPGSPPPVTVDFVDDTAGTPTQNGPVADASTSYPLPNGFCNSGAWIGPSGLQVTASDTHPTAVLGVVGINSATEKATSIALIGTPTGADLAPYGVWYELCPSGSLVAGSTTVTLLSTSWDGTTCGLHAYVPKGSGNSFKGYFKLPGPLPVTSDTGCIQTGTGSGIGAGTDPNPPASPNSVFVPLITGVYRFGDTLPAGCALITAEGTWDLTFSGLAYVSINPSSSTSITGTYRQGVVTPTGLVICPVRDASCSSSSPSSKIVVPYIWQ